MSRAAAGTITIAPAPEGAWLIFTGMDRPPLPAVRWLSSLEAARSFGIAMHQTHGWPIEERYPGDQEACE